MNYVYALLRSLAAAAAVATITGCATPNLQPFAEQTAALAQAVEGEQREVSLKFSQVIKLYEETCKNLSAQGRGQAECEAVKLRGDQRILFDESRRIIDALLQRASVYAVTLAELAKAGETGSEAAQSLLTAVKQLGTVVGVTSAVTGVAADALQEIGKAVNRVQAQRSLSEATEKAQEAVAGLADGVVTIYKDANGNRDPNGIAGALYGDEYDLLAVVAGRHLVGLFQEASASREVVNQRIRQRRSELTDINGCPAAATGERAEICKAVLNDLRNTEDIAKLLERLRPDYDAVVAKRAAALRWREQRSENAKAIVKAALAWKEEHARVAEHLKRCGGLNAYRCVEINPATLKGLVDRVNEIRQQKDK